MIHEVAYVEAGQEENRGSAQKIAWRSRSATQRYPWLFPGSELDLPKGLVVVSDWLSQFTETMELAKLHAS
jgi:hypothetical protein